MSTSKGLWNGVNESDDDGEVIVQKIVEVNTYWLWVKNLDTFDYVHLRLDNGHCLREMHSYVVCEHVSDKKSVSNRANYNMR